MSATQTATRRALPQSQKAWMIVRKGKPSEALVLEKAAEVPSKLAKGEVLIRVEAAALNPM